MNIFFTDDCPYKAASNLDDKRVIKMILESAQMLCTALDAYGAFTKYEYTPVKFVKDKDTDILVVKAGKKIKYAYYADLTRVYAPTHANHPSNVWARQNLLNWSWLYNHAIGLCNEYHKRYGKRHKSWTVLITIAQYSSLLPVKAQTPFANCAAHAGKGISYKHVTNTVEAYRRYLADRWSTDKKHPTWSNTQAPLWISYSQSNKFFLTPKYDLLGSRHE